MYAMGQEWESRKLIYCTLFKVEKHKNLSESCCLILISALLQGMFLLTSTYVIQAL